MPRAIFKDITSIEQMVECQIRWQAGDLQRTYQQTSFMILALQANHTIMDKTLETKQPAKLAYLLPSLSADKHLVKALNKLQVILQT